VHTRLPPRPQLHGVEHHPLKQLMGGCVAARLLGVPVGLVLLSESDALQFGGQGAPGAHLVLLLLSSGMPASY
jgi:hypothetical protein